MSNHNFPAKTMVNARVQLKELRDRNAWTLKYLPVEQVGPQHAPTHNVQVVCLNSGGDTVMTGHGNGSTKRNAQEAACRAALGEAWVDPGPAANPDADVQALASVGDAIIDVTINLLGYRAELSAQQLDGVRQSAASNEALALLLPHPMASAHTAATAVEAAVGREVELVSDQLLAILLPALQRANGGLLPSLEAAVALA